MATVYSELDERLIEFILEQPVFFVATAPCLDESGAGGHVNVSPKGYRDTFAIIDPLTVAYLDLTGSGAETIAHLRQNGRITVMFCSFDRQPKILRIYGAGQVILPDDPRWPALAGHFHGAATAAGETSTAAASAAPTSDISPTTRLNPHDSSSPTTRLPRDNSSPTDRIEPSDHLSNPTSGVDNPTSGVDWEGGDDGSLAEALALEHGVDRGNHRAIILVTADRISDSCGYAVPRMELTEERDLLTRWAERRSPEDLVDYRIKHNTHSIDGLPALS